VNEALALVGELSQLRKWPLFERMKVVSSPTMRLVSYTVFQGVM
jgi:hypothetical protein